MGAGMQNYSYHQAVIFRVFFALLIALSLVFCGYVFAHETSIYSVFFDEGSPAPSARLEDSLVNYQTSLEILKNNIDAINYLSNDSRVVLVGSTDGEECVVNECRELSLKRASLIYAWLVEHGIPAKRLLPAVGLGRDYPVANNGTRDGRARNRRVDFCVIENDKKFVPPCGSR